MSYISSFVTILAAYCTIVDGLATNNKRGGAVPASSITPIQWAQLNQTVGGKLVGGVPLGQPCYSSYNGNAQTPNLADCSTVQQGYTSELFIASRYGGYMNSNWATCQAKGQGCPLNFNNPALPTDYAPTQNCYQGSVSPYYVAATSETDVQAVLAFVRQTGVRLNIKNSGHDYKGRSSAPDSLGLWTHTIQKPITLVKNFVPDGCTASVGDVVHLSAGQNFDGLYAFSYANNITVIGGSSRTVGPAGGWAAGGGHSSLSNTLGLGADNIVQIKAVMPDGTFITANACQNPDMWFALRGGGGSTFGVNIEVTMKAYPQISLQVAYVRFISTDTKVFTDFTKLIIAQSYKWSTEGWGGYISLAAQGSQANGFILLTPKLSLADAQTSMKPITDYVATLGSIVLNNDVETSNSFFEAYTKYVLPNAEQVGIGIALASRLIPSSQLQGSDNQAQVLNALTNIANTVSYPKRTSLLDATQLTYGGPLQILVTTPSSYTTPDTTSAITPAWRSAIWHVIAGTGFANEASSSDIASAFQAAHDVGNILRSLAPQSGAYQNEAEVFEPDPAGTYWGQENYQRLINIKQQIDPANILTCWNCIGSDPSDARFACYPSAPS